jgi:hypothetical protein
MLCCDHKCGDIWGVLGRVGALMFMLHGPIVCVELFCWYSPLLVRYVIGVGRGLLCSSGIGR